MEDHKYEEKVLYLKDKQFPFRLPRGSKKRKNWAASVRKNFKVLPDTKSTAVIYRLAKSKTSANSLGQQQRTYVWQVKKSEVSVILEWAHKDSGHGGRDVMLAKLKPAYYWKGKKRFSKTNLKE